MSKKPKKKNLIGGVDYNLVLDFHEYISRDIRRIFKYFPTEFSLDGHMEPEKDFFLFPISTIPKTRSKNSKKRVKYKECLTKQIGGMKNFLKDFKNKEVLIYIITYLTKQNYKEKDVDNLAKPILDSLKQYIGDDSKIKTLIIEKQLIPEDSLFGSEWGEEILIVVTLPKYGEFLLKGK